MEFLDRIPKLIAGWLRGDLTTGEQKELDDWINESEANKVFFEETTNEKLLVQELREFKKKDLTPILNNTLQQVYPETKGTNSARLIQMKRYMVAAVLVVIAGTAIYLLTRSKTDQTNSTASTNTIKNDVAPGTDKAILTLADGSTIQLNQSENKKIADENGTAVNQQGTQLVYDASKSPSIGQKTLSYNMLSTERGGQFRVILPDGSRVWLNAVSSIRFPTAFAGKERSVEITGEAYFEVARDVKKPFKVTVKGIAVEVLGTHFNVNAYDDEAFIRATLVEGKIKVTSSFTNKSYNSREKVLNPGQAAVINASGVIDIKQVDTDQAISWRNNSFYFQDDDIETIGRQLSRWYNVDIIYEGKVVRKYTGIISRDIKVSEILKFLEASGGVHFTIDGNKIHITP